MKTDLFQSCGHCWVFQMCWHIAFSTFTASSFRIWNSSTGILSQKKPILTLCWKMFLWLAFQCFYYYVLVLDCSVVSNSLWPHGLYSPPGSSGHGILHPVILEWVAMPSSRGIFPTQGSNPGLLHCRQILYQLSHKESPRILEWVAYPFSSGSFQRRNQTGVSCIAGRFFTNRAIREALPSA